MKKLLLIFTAVIVTTATVNAQKGVTRFSIGAELSAPSGQFNNYGYKVGFGGSLQAEQKVANDLGLTVNLGYLSYGNKTSSSYHYSVIPLLAGLKYYISPKVYAQGQLGAGFTTLKLPSRNFTKTNFVYSPGIGFMVSNNVDILVKYTGISNSIAFFDNNGNFIPNVAASTFGVRLALSF